MLKKLSFRASYFLIILILFHLIGNIVWIKLNNTPPAWDQAAHTVKSILFSRFISSGDVSLFIAGLDTHYGPFVFFLTGSILAITGISIKTAQLMGTVFFVGTFIALYFIARDILHNKWVGVLSVFLFSFGLVVYDYSRWLLLDIPIVCFVLFGMYFFMKSHALKERAPALLMFLFITMAVYTKIQAISYFVLPFLYAFIISVKKRDRAIFINLILGVILVTILFLPWMVYRWSAIVNYFSIVSIPEAGAYPSNILTFQYWIHYIKLTVNQIFTAPILLIILFMGIISGWKAKYPWKMFLIFQTVFIYLSYSILVHKDIRYIFPAVAIFTIIASIWIKSFVQKYPIIGITLLCIVMILSIGQYTASSFGFPRFLINRLITVNVPILDDITIFNTSGWPVVRYNSQEFPQRAILRKLDEVAHEGGGRVRVAVLVSVPEFNGNNLYLYSLEKKQNYNLEFGGTGAYVFTSLQAAEDYLDTFNYLLFSPDNGYMSYQLDVEALQQIEKVITHKINNHSLYVESTFLLPSGKRIFLLKNIYPIIP